MSMAVPNPRFGNPSTERAEHGLWLFAQLLKRRRLYSFLTVWVWRKNRVEGPIAFLSRIARWCRWQVAAHSDHGHGCSTAKKPMRVHIDNFLQILKWGSDGYLMGLDIRCQHEMLEVQPRRGLGFVMMFHSCTQLAPQKS
jgi:hypothetical protein